MHASVRAPAVAGTFYPASSAALAAAVDGYLEDARAQLLRSGETQAPPPKAIVAPHAGYVYSGPIAASAFVRLEPLRDRITRVVLVAPAHRVYVSGLVAPGVHWLETPLGRLEVDEEALERVPEVGINNAAHAREHALEVELPFIQRVLPNAKVVPLAVGEATPAQVARVLDRLWGGEETVIVVSSDLSHYLPYAEGRAEDEATCAKIVALDGPIEGEQACGAAGVNGLLVVALRRRLVAELVDLRSSGDTAGSKEEVVGYAAVVFREGKPAPGTDDDPTKHGAELARYARAAVRQKLGGPKVEPPKGAWAEQPGATFVTLRWWRNHELQGCIGRLEAERPIAEDAAANAIAAATLDPRAAPLELARVDELDLELSILSPLEPLRGRTEEEVLAELRPGIDGVVLSARHGRRATFLPSMWEVFGDARTLLRELKEKAGLSPDVWREDFRVLRYTVDKTVDVAPSRKSAS